MTTTKNTTTDFSDRFIDASRPVVEVARLQAHLDARWLAFDGDHRGARHGGGKRLGAAHTTQPRGQEPFALELAAIVLAAHFGEGLIGALHDALRADIDP